MALPWRPGWWADPLDEGAAAEPARGATWQPYLELQSSSSKEVVVSAFLLALPAAVRHLLQTVATPPWCRCWRPPRFDTMGDLVVLVYLLLLGTFFLALAGLDPGSAFEAWGSREVTVAALAEPTVALAVFALALSAGSTNLGRIVVATLADPATAEPGPPPAAFAALFIVTLAETGRLPVDNPATHLELDDPRGHGPRVLGTVPGLIEWAAAVKLLSSSPLLGNLFVPWGVARTLTRRRSSWPWGASC